MKKRKRILHAILLFVAVIFINGIYFVFSGQRKAAERLNGGGRLNLYECGSAYTMHMALWMIGWPMSPAAAHECFALHFPQRRDTLIIENRRMVRSILSPRIVAAIRALEDKPSGTELPVRWNGNISYASSSPEHAAAIALNPCTVIKSEQIKDWEPVYLIRCQILYPKRSDTRIDLGPFFIPLQEGLFRHIQDRGWLSRYVAEYRVPASLLSKM